MKEISQKKLWYSINVRPETWEITVVDSFDLFLIRIREHTRKIILSLLIRDWDYSIRG